MRLIRGLAAGAMISGVLVLAPGTAQAAGWPSNCWYDFGPGPGAIAQCKSGGGYFKATVACDPITGGSRVFREARNWVRPGRNATSVVSCPTGTVPAYPGILKKSG